MKINIEINEALAVGDDDFVIRTRKIERESELFQSTRKMSRSSDVFEMKITETYSAERYFKAGKNFVDVEIYFELFVCRVYDFVIVEL